MTELALICAVCGGAPSLAAAPMNPPSATSHRAEEAPPAEPKTAEAPSWDGTPQRLTFGALAAGSSLASYGLAARRVEGGQWATDAAGTSLGLLASQLVGYALAAALHDPDRMGAAVGLSEWTGVAFGLGGLSLAESLSGRPVYGVALLGAFLGTAGFVLATALVGYAVLRLFDALPPPRAGARAATWPGLLLFDAWVGTLAAGGYALAVPAHAPYLR